MRISPAATITTSSPSNGLDFFYASYPKTEKSFVYLHLTFLLVLNSFRVS